MLRFLTVPALVLFVFACDPSQAEGEIPTAPCVETATPDAVDSRELETESVRPTIGQSAKNAAVWVKERVMRYLSVDSDAYPQRPHPSKQS